MHLVVLAEGRNLEALVAPECMRDSSRREEPRSAGFLTADVTARKSLRRTRSRASFCSIVAARQSLLVRMTFSLCLVWSVGVGPPSSPGRSLPLGAAPHPSPLSAPPLSGLAVGVGSCLSVASPVGLVSMEMFTSLGVWRMQSGWPHWSAPRTIVLHGVHGSVHQCLA